MKQQIQIPFNFIPRDYQLELFKAMDSGIRNAFLRWHRRAGKDKACWCYMVKQAFAKPGLYYYFLPEYSMARKIIWEGRDKDGFAMLDHIPHALIKRKDNKEMMLELDSGSIIRLIGTDRYDSIRGTNPIGAVYSEFAFQDKRAAEVLAPIFRENKGWQIFNSTPNGRNHMFDMDNRVKNNKYWYYSVLQTLWPDRPNYSGIVDPESIEQDKALGYDDDHIAREYGVAYSVGLKGSYYIDQVEKAREEGRIGFFPPSRHKVTDTFWDVGIGDSTVIWFRQYDGNKVILVDYLEEAGLGTDDLVFELAQRGYNYRTHYLPHDAAQRQKTTAESVDQFLRTKCAEAGMSDDVVVLDRQPVQTGIMAVRQRFGKYHFNEELCEDGIHHIEMYHRRYNKATDSYSDHPVHDDHSHAADALRYEAMSEEWSDPFYNQQDATQVSTYFDPWEV